MGSLVWKSLGGNWNDPGAWTVVAGDDVIPGAIDDATINAPLNYGVTVSGAQAARDVTIDATGAHVEIAGTLAVGNMTLDAGTLDLAGTLEVAGTLALPGGPLTTTATSVLQGGTVSAAGNVFGASGTLDGVTVLGTLFVANATLNVEGGLAVLGATGNGPGVLQGQGPGTATVEFLDSETLNNELITGELYTIDVSAGATLTLGPQVDTMASRLLFGGAGHLVNEGTFTPDPALTATIGVDNPWFENTGQILISTATSTGTKGFMVAGDFVNNGTYSGDFLDTGGTLSGSGVTDTNAVTAGAIAAGVDIVRLSQGRYAGLSVTAESISPQATIEGFVAAGSIDLTALPYSFNENVFWSGTPAGGTLTIANGTTPEAALFLTGIASGATFSIGSDGAATPGTRITTTNTPCFRAGTRLRTLRGDVAVERLVVGDRIPGVRSGRVQEVRWIGVRRAVARGHPRPEAVWPVRVSAGAIAPGVPRCDVWLSPEHAVFIHGVLVPVRHLLNGLTIVQVPCREVVYYHVELPVHDLVQSEGMLSESYLDTGNRADFENAGAMVNAHPAFGADHANRVWQARACAPQVRGGAELAAIRAALARRAALLATPGGSITPVRSWRSPAVAPAVPA